MDLTEIQKDLAALTRRVKKIRPHAFVTMTIWPDRVHLIAHYARAPGVDFKVEGPNLADLFLQMDELLDAADPRAYAADFEGVAP